MDSNAKRFLITTTEGYHVVEITDTGYRVSEPYNRIAILCVVEGYGVSTHTANQLISNSMTMNDFLRIMKSKNISRDLWVLLKSFF